MFKVRNVYILKSGLWLGHLVGSLSLHSCEFNPRPVHVGFVVDREALGQVYLLSMSVNVLYVPIMGICCTLCVFVMLCVYCCS